MLTQVGELLSSLNALKGTGMRQAAGYILLLLVQTTTAQNTIAEGLNMKVPSLLIRRCSTGIWNGIDQLNTFNLAGTIPIGVTDHWEFGQNLHLPVCEKITTAAGSA